MRSLQTFCCFPARAVATWAVSLLWVACGGGDLSVPETGALVIRTVTDNPPSGLEGYTVSVDGGTTQPIAPNDAITIPDLPVGDHSTQLAGVPEQCVLAGDNPRTATVPADGRTEVDFDVTCPVPGSVVTVTTTTSGLVPDPDGYTVQVDGSVEVSIDVNGSVLLSPLAPGPHSLLLTGVAPNCTVAGDNPRAIETAAGAPLTVEFAVTCVGVVTVTTTTSGLGPDPDGYTVQVDGSVEVSIDVNGSVLLSPLAPGPHSLLLTGVAPNCTVAGDNPRAIETAAGAPLTVEFAVTCVGGPLQFTEMTSGTNADLAEDWGTGPTDVFAVGELETQGGQGVASVILHFDGGAWQPQYRQDDLSLRGVWGSSATDVYAVGFHFIGLGAALLHYNGVAWVQADNFTDQDEELAFQGIWGSSATDVFAVGIAFDGRFQKSLIVHYDGSGWRRMDPPVETSPRLSDVWGSGPTDVYAVGRDEVSEVAVIIRYDGGGWSPVLEEEDLGLNAVWGSSATDVFAVGFAVSNGARVTSAVRHFDGASWTRMDVPNTGVLNDVWGSSATDVYAVADDGGMLHYDGSVWTESRPSQRTLLGIWGSSAADVFLVGNRDTIVHGAP